MKPRFDLISALELQKSIEDTEAKLREQLAAESEETQAELRKQLERLQAEAQAAARASAEAEAAAHAWAETEATAEAEAKPEAAVQSTSPRGSPPLPSIAASSQRPPPPGTPPRDATSPPHPSSSPPPGTPPRDATSPQPGPPRPSLFAHLTPDPEAIAMTAVQGELAKAQWLHALAAAEARRPA